MRVMNITIKLSNEKPSHNDILFILGSLEIIDEDKKIHFFENGLCMIFLTLDSLTDFLFSKNNAFDWVGEDSGQVYSVRKSKDNLVFFGKNIQYTCNKNSFCKALFRAITDRLLMIHNKGKKPNILT